MHGWMDGWMSVCLPVCLPACLSAWLPACLPGWLAGWLSVCLSVWRQVGRYARLCRCILYVCMHVHTVVEFLHTVVLVYLRVCLSLYVRFVVWKDEEGFPFLTH